MTVNHQNWNKKIIVNRQSYNPPPPYGREKNCKTKQSIEDGGIVRYEKLSANPINNRLM